MQLPQLSKELDRILTAQTKQSIGTLWDTFPNFIRLFFEDTDVSNHTTLYDTLFPLLHILTGTDLEFKDFMEN